MLCPHLSAVFAINKFFTIQTRAIHNGVKATLKAYFEFQEPGLELAWPRCQGCLAPTEFLDSNVWHTRILAILPHNVVEFDDLIVVGTRCFKFQLKP